MATKTISLEIDAYERLKASKKPGESFSEVVRRAQFADSVPTGKDLLEWMRKGASGVSKSYLDEVEEAEKKTTCSLRIHGPDRRYEFRHQHNPVSLVF